MCGVLHCARLGTEGVHRSICVHEHVEEIPYCAICLGRLQRESLYCIPCYDNSSEPHYCTSRLISPEVAEKEMPRQPGHEHRHVDAEHEQVNG